MATTTNYGWTTPDDTDLVKDGAAAIRTLGSSVDTTTKALNPETTTGDIAYRSATANTNTRLALGTAGQVLTVNSGETAPEWAAVAGGGYTELASGTLSASALSITSISNGYRDLILICKNFQRSTAFDLIFQVNSDTASNYSWLVTGNPSSVVTTAANSNSTAIVANSVNFKLSTDAQCVVQFLNYADTATTKIGQFNSGGFDNAANLKLTNEGSFMYNSTSAISSIQTTQTFVSGTYVLYGVK
jgi:hypothetical protein